VGRLDRTISRLSRPRPAPAPDLRSVTDRLDALEALVEGLQDSVDRQAHRQDERIEELARAMTPVELARALSEDARRRGLE
jgi:hypothetical protein